MYVLVFTKKKSTYVFYQLSGFHSTSLVSFLLDGAVMCVYKY